MQVSLIPQIEAYPVSEIENQFNCYSKNRSEFFLVYIVPEIHQSLYLDWVFLRCDASQVSRISGADVEFVVKVTKGTMDLTDAEASRLQETNQGELNTALRERYVHRAFALNPSKQSAVPMNPIKFHPTLSMKSFVSDFASLNGHLTNIRHGISDLSWREKTELSRIFGMKMDGAGRLTMDELVEVPVLNRTAERPMLRTGGGSNTGAGETIKRRSWMDIKANEQNDGYSADSGESWSEAISVK